MNSAEVAIGKLLIVGNVGAADTGGLDGNLKLSEPGVLDLSLFLINSVSIKVGIL